jgi:hypothetical protein
VVEIQHAAAEVLSYLRQRPQAEVLSALQRHYQSFVG